MMEHFYTSKYTTTPTAPDFCLQLHINVYQLATELRIPGLQDYASNSFASNLSNHVDNLHTFFMAIRKIYTTHSTINSPLRLAVVDTAVSEMKAFLANPAVWTSFTGIMAELPVFQKDVMYVMTMAQDKPPELRPTELCKDCGPRAEGDGYEVHMTCQGCGSRKSIKFL